MKDNHFHVKLGRSVILSLLLLLLMTQGACGESMDNMINQFEKEFEAAKPAPNSSVNSDYKLEQAALGTLYTTRALNKLFEQNKEMLQRYDEMLFKYNEMIAQNKEMIRLLTIMVKKEAAEGKAETGAISPLE